ncbi:MAG: sigma-70 family RNA polymerase sigma factor [bacterium]|nr:sigma-70 family RNA polymerase sigma factor [bacterium]
MSKIPDSTPDPPRPQRQEDVTLLLHRIKGGDTTAIDELLPLVYQHLRATAGEFFGGQPQQHTLQPTALVHEAFLKLVRNPEMNWRDRKHFFTVAATAMRQILVDHARGKARLKRGAGALHVTHSEIPSPFGAEGVDILDLERALTKLAELSPRQARIIELWFFAGLKVDDVGKVLEVSDRTIRRDWTHARAWLRRELNEGQV